MNKKRKQADKMYLRKRKLRLTNFAGSSKPPIEKIIKRMKKKPKNSVKSVHTTLTEQDISSEKKETLSSEDNDIQSDDASES